ncbi:hypothetical protein SH449x_004920 [Pirellulaceae bacterium SH449]
MKPSTALFAFVLVCLGWPIAIANAQDGEGGGDPQRGQHSLQIELQETLSDEIGETKQLSKQVEEAVDNFDLYAARDSENKLVSRPVFRWRNAARGQDGEAMLAIWLNNGYPLAMASIFPWEKTIQHEFDLLAGTPGLIAKSGERVIWAPESAAVKFKIVPEAESPAASPAVRLRQMKAIAVRFEGKLTGWNPGDTDNEFLRLLPRPLYRYEITERTESKALPVDGALFAFAAGTDPEIVLMLEAVENDGHMIWEYACVRATSGGLEMRLDGSLVWTAAKDPENTRPELPHFTARSRLR